MYPSGVSHAIHTIHSGMNEALKELSCTVFYETLIVGTNGFSEKGEHLSKRDFCNKVPNLIKSFPKFELI